MSTVTRTLTSVLPFSFSDLRMALLVTRRELRDSFRDWRIIIPIIILTLVFPALATFTARVILNFAQQYGGELIGQQLIPFLLLVVGFFPMSFSLVIALETFVGEKERKSLEPLLATPLTNTQLYVGKVLAAVIPPMVTSYLGIIVYMVGLAIAVRWIIPPGLITQILLLSTIQGILMVAAAVIVSSQTTSVRAANLLASFIIVPVALLLQFEAVVLFWGNSEGLWWLILALAVTTGILIRMGVKIFNREDLLGQDIDQLRLGWTLSRLGGQFTAKTVAGRYPNPIQWYRHLFELLPRLRLPSFTLILSLLGGVVLGLILAGQYPLPAEARDQLTGTDIVNNVSNIQLLASELPRTIFLQNIRVVILAAILGIFTLGVTDVIVFMITWILVGFLAGQLAWAGQNPLTFFVAAILPHAIVELPALLLASAAMLRWHASILARPENRTVGESWLLAAADFGRVFVGLVVPLLFIAALLEAYLTPRIILLIYGS